MLERNRLVEFSFESYDKVNESIVNNVFMVNIPLKEYIISSGAEWFAETAITNNTYPKNILYFGFCPNKYYRMTFSIPGSNGGGNEEIAITIIILSTIGGISVVIIVVVIRKIKLREIVI